MSCIGRVASRVAVGCVLVLGGAGVGFGQSVEVVITEFIPNPAGTDTQREWFEVYNAGSGQVDLNGWTVKDDDSDSHPISNSNGTTTIDPGHYLVLGVNADTNTNGGVTVNYDYASFTLGNGVDEIVLVDVSMT